jgi:hypothetical protein
MYWPGAWKRAARVRRALADYPLFSPPHLQNSAFLDFQSAKENERYFFDHRTERMQALSQFMRTFGVEMAVDGPGLTAASAWIAGHAGLLVPNLNSRGVRQAFYRFARPWTGRRRGLNAVFDLGLFFGECIIAKNPKCYWRGFVGAAPGQPPRPVCDVGWTGIGIQGSRRKPFFDPFQLMENMCANLQSMHKVSLLTRDPAENDPGYVSRLVEIYGDTKRYPGRPL